MDSDIPYHYPSKFQVGDRVKVMRSVPKAHAWHSRWEAPASRMVGGTARIREVHPLAGYFCEIRGMARAWMPSCALESVASLSKECVITVPSV